MDAKEFLESVCKEIKYKPAKKVIYKELEAHIEDVKAENMSKGILEGQAEENAVKQMGNPQQIGKNLNKIHKPRLEWKIFNNWIKYNIYNSIYYTYTEEPKKSRIITKIGQVFFEKRHKVVN